MEGFKHKINKEIKRTKAKIEQEMLAVKHDHHDAVAGKEVISQTTEGQDNESETTTEKETNEMLDSEQKLLLKSKRKRLQKALTLESEQRREEEAGIEYFQKFHSLMSLNGDFPRFGDFLKSSIRFMNRANAYSIQKKGRVLIIENTEFDSPDLKTREGSDKDREKLEMFFQDLGFKVIIKQNLKADEMIQVLHVEVDKNEGRNEDCFILIFLSHGQESEIFGTDSKTITYSAIYKEFNESTIWNDDLQPKPKLIYIQACQNAFEEDQENQNVSPGGHFYVMYATIPGNYAYRNEQNGSRFIQSLINVYNKNFLDEDIETMGITIKQDVYEMPNKANTQQIAASISSLAKRMYLPEVQEKKKDA